MLDFVPNLAFLVGAYFLVRWVRLTSNRLSVVAMIAGSSLVFLGGTLKAIWKLLQTMGIGDFWLLSELQFILLAPGFLAMLASVLLVLKQERESWKPGLLAMAPWKIPLLATMTLSSLGLQGILSYMAFQRKAYLAAAMYIIAILCVLGLAGLAGGEQSIARQWIEEGINSMGQIAFALGSYLLYSRTEMVRE
jgi:hypothetical protein